MSALSVLVASSNVATLSDERPQHFGAWLSHLRSVLFPSPPHDLVVLHLQEVGGVKWTSQKVAEFAERLQSALLTPSSADYWCSGLVIDLEASRFTALATVILVRRLSASRFRRRHFASGELVAVADVDHAVCLVPAAGHAFFRHEKFEGSASRKGFLVSEWGAGGRALSVANVHLFHDDSNLVALDASPSLYAAKRAAALRTVVQRLPPGPALLAGDFNFRLDLAPFLAWLRARAPSAPAADGHALLVQKDVFQCAFLDALMSDPAAARSAREAFDRELVRFNADADAATRLAEEPIAFPPTYPIEGAGRWSTKRAPAWCDRIVYNAAAAALFAGARTYAALQASADTPLGSDHLPVYLHFTLATS